MSAAIADFVGEHIAGQQAANLFLESARNGMPHPDSLHAAAMKVWADHGSRGLVGFHRVLMKRIERAGGAA